MAFCPARGLEPDHSPPRRFNSPMPGNKGWPNPHAAGSAGIPQAEVF
jgi:hypothetical protein